MKFITEANLRELYKQNPFTNYTPVEGERLTPGARQYLIDLGFNMYNKSDPYISGSSLGCGITTNAPFKKQLTALGTAFLLAFDDGKPGNVYLELYSIYTRIAELSGVSLTDKAASTTERELIPLLATLYSDTVHLSSELEKLIDDEVLRRRIFNKLKICSGLLSQEICRILGGDKCRKNG